MSVQCYFICLQHWRIICVKCVFQAHHVLRTLKGSSADAALLYHTCYSDSWQSHSTALRLRSKVSSVWTKARVWECVRVCACVWMCVLTCWPLEVHCDDLLVLVLDATLMTLWIRCGASGLLRMKEDTVSSVSLDVFPVESIVCVNLHRCVFSSYWLGFLHLQLRSASLSSTAGRQTAQPSTYTHTRHHTSSLITLYSFIHAKRHAGECCVALPWQPSVMMSLRDGSMCRGSSLRGRLKNIVSDQAARLGKKLNCVFFLIKNNY